MDQLKRHPAQGKIFKNFDRPTKATLTRFSSFYSAFILDHFGKHGWLRALRPLTGSMQVCGPATTVMGPDLDLRRAAIDLAKPGDVLVVASGTHDYACFGDGTAKRMQLKGMAGAVIDGLTRDAGRIIRLGFPTFCAGISPRNHHYPVAEQYGGVNVPVCISGVLVNPGDLVFGDYDGVVVVPREEADLSSVLIENALAVECHGREKMTSFEPFQVEAILRARGYSFE